MAKVIRNQWVYKKDGHWYRYLPRRNDAPKDFNYEENMAGPDHFLEKMENKPPKLWLAWIYRSYATDPSYIRRKIEKLFGKDAEPGKMFVFKNTASQNAELWPLKHIIELRPLTFPYGEPTPKDVNALEVFPDGRCVISKHLVCEPSHLQVMDPRKQMSSSYLCSRLRSRYARCQDIFETNVYTAKNVTLIE